MSDFGALVRESHDFATHLMESNVLFRRAAEGTLEQHHVAQFLENVRYLITFTVPHLTRAAELAKERGMPELAEAYREEIGEESGHEKWAESDLKQVEGKFGPVSVSTMDAARKMVQYTREELETDPAVLMAYAFFIENLTLAIGPRLIGDFESKCGVPREMLSVIANHVQLDSGHAVEGEAAIEAFLKQHPERLGGFEKITRNTMRLFTDFCTEVCQAA